MAHLDFESAAGGLRARMSGPILWLELDRAGRHNALDSTLFTALSEVLDRAIGDPAIRVIVVGGAGDRAFCAGADLDEMSGLDTESAHRLITRGQAVFQRLAELPVPTIAAVNGAALGGGFELALSCTLTIASEKATFGLPETGLGLMPGYGGTQRLPLAIGPSTAMRLMLTGERIGAHEAFECGFLAARPMAPDGLDEEVRRVAGLIAARGPVATARVLEAVRGVASPTAAGLAHEASLAAMCVSSSEAAEGIAAFKDRRQVSFSDRRVDAHAGRGGRPDPMPAVSSSGAA